MKQTVTDERVQEIAQEVRRVSSAAKEKAARHVEQITVAGAAAQAVPQQARTASNSLLGSIRGLLLCR